MLWAILAILSAALFSAVVIVDKYLLTKYIRNPMLSVIMVGTIGIFASIIIYLYNGFTQLSLIYTSLAIFIGILFVPQVLFYFKALQIGEASRIVPLFYMSPIIIMILATIFLGEVLTLWKYIGIIMIVLGSIMISTKNITKISFGKEFWFMIISVVVLSAITIMTKYLLNSVDYWTIFAYTRIGNFIAVLPLIYIYRKDLNKLLTKSGKKVVGLFVTNESVGIVASLLGTAALSFGLASLVMAISSVQPFIVLLYTIILSLFLPKILSEEVSRTTVTYKIAAISIIFVGAYLILA